MGVHQDRFCEAILMDSLKMWGRCENETIIIKSLNEPRRERAGFLHVQKQGRRSAAQ